MTDSNRTVLITGAAQGLGRAMSVRLLEQGFNVAAVDRDSNGLSALGEQIAAGPKFEGFVADLIDFDAPKLAAQVEKRFGRIDILINNAGIGQGQLKPDYHVNLRSYAKPMVPGNRGERKRDLSSQSRRRSCLRGNWGPTIEPYRR